MWHYAAIAKAVVFLTFEIDVSIFTYLDTVSFAESCEFYKILTH